MENYGEGIAKRELDLVFVIDQSGSMAGEKIGAVNNAVRDIMAIMPEIQDDTIDAEIKISALTFSDEAKWVYQEPKGVTEFKWNDISTIGGTDYSKVYEKLSSFLTKRSNGGQMPDMGGLAPILIFMTDGEPTDYTWEEKLATLKKKGWFKVALKYALAIGIDTDEAMEVLTKFTGNSETVLKVYTAEALRKVIRVIAVTASKVKSSGSTQKIGENAAKPQDEIINDQVKKQLEDDDGIEW